MGINGGRSLRGIEETGGYQKFNITLPPSIIKHVYSLHGIQDISIGFKISSSKFFLCITAKMNIITISKDLIVGKQSTRFHEGAIT